MKHELHERMLYKQCILHSFKKDTHEPIYMVYTRLVTYRDLWDGHLGGDDLALPLHGPHHVLRAAAHRRQRLRQTQRGEGRWRRLAGRHGDMGILNPRIEESMAQGPNLS